MNKFVVEIEDGEKREFDTAIDAVNFSRKKVHLDWERADDAVILLESGHSFSYSYGFAAANIYCKRSSVLYTQLECIGISRESFDKTISLALNLQGMQATHYHVDDLAVMRFYNKDYHDIEDTLALPEMSAEEFLDFVWNIVQKHGHQYLTPENDQAIGYSVRIGDVILFSAHHALVYNRSVSS
jgi:hypothetical protein